MHRDGLARFGRLNGSFCCLRHTGALECRDFYDPAAKLFGKLCGIDLVPVLFHDVHHIDGNDNGDTEFGKLGSQVQIAFQIGAVHDIQDRIRPFADQIVSGDDLFQRIGGERVDAGKVCNDDVVIFFQLAFLFLYRDARPVAYKLR